MITLSDIIGMIGVSLIIFAYFMLQLQKFSSEDLSFSLINITGSLLILYSLTYNWNLSSVIIEVFWILISLIGVYKHIKNSK